MFGYLSYGLPSAFKLSSHDSILSFVFSMVFSRHSNPVGIQSQKRANSLLPKILACIPFARYLGCTICPNCALSRPPLLVKAYRFFPTGSIATVGKSLCDVFPWYHWCGIFCLIVGRQLMWHFISGQELMPPLCKRRYSLVCFSVTSLVSFRSIEEKCAWSLSQSYCWDAGWFFGME